jgi:hypothetical protein
MGARRRQFTLRAILWLTAKAACLLAVMAPWGSWHALGTLAIWLAAELAFISSPDRKVPIWAAAAFALARMLLAITTCEVLLTAVTLADIARGATQLQALGDLFALFVGLTILLCFIFLASLAGCVIAAISWRWDRRARWFVYLGGGYVVSWIALAIVLNLTV